MLEGTPGDDVICGRGGDDRLVGRGGDDQLRGGGVTTSCPVVGATTWRVASRARTSSRAAVGDDRLRGGKGNDQLDGRDAGAFTDSFGAARGRLTARSPTWAMTWSPVVRCQPERPAHRHRAEAGHRGARTRRPARWWARSRRRIPTRGTSTSFSLVAGRVRGDNGSFTVQGTRLLTAAVFDFEADPSLSIRVRAADLEGATYAKGPDGRGHRCRRERCAGGRRRLADHARGHGTPPAGGRFRQPGGQRHRRRRRPADRDRGLGCRRRYGGDHGRHDPVHARPPNLCGVAAGRFDYTVSDGHGGSDVGRVTVDITCVPDDPTAADDAVTRAEDSAATAIAVLANDTDADGGPVVIGSVTQPANGTVVITGGGSRADLRSRTRTTATPARRPADTFTYTLTPAARRPRCR